MQDDTNNTDLIIELIAKSLDEPLSAPEQAQVNEAIQNSIAIRIAADGLREFDALLKRTGMAIPDEGFPARVLFRLEAYERRRNRTQWLLTLGMVFLGLLAVSAWFAWNGAELVNTLLFFTAGAILMVPLAFAFFIALLTLLGQGALLIYAFIVLALTLIWARASGAFQQTNPSL